MLAIKHLPTLSLLFIVNYICQHAEASNLPPPKTKPFRPDQLNFFENIEDLDHLAYLLLRNYNITDESLLQLSWLTSLGSSLGSHKQHQYASGPPTITDNKSRLALELESFISHLRNGHLRRVSQKDLEISIEASNLTESSVKLRKHYHRDVSISKTSTKRKGGQFLELQPTYPESKTADDDDETRCAYLVTLYKFELNYRQPKGQTIGVSNSDQQILAGTGSRVEYLDPSSNDASNLPQPEPTRQKSLNISASIEAPTVRSRSSDEINSTNSEFENSPISLDESRLMNLCRLAVTCQSTEDMVRLIGHSWTRGQLVRDHPSDQRLYDYDDVSIDQNRLAKFKTVPKQQVPELDESLKHKRSSEANKFDHAQESYHETMNRDDDYSRLTSFRHRNFRDSLSMSLAKLCPLMLFQLHEDDGQCIVARDDTPPILAVWGFATLFVTIVSFCSLIGLSITPLIGHSPTADNASIGSSSSSSSSESSIRVGKASIEIRDNPGLSNNSSQQQPNQQCKATLTVFEGLAVGSLVGSALFSLIPQAFELQERESNQSFLLKAFIIFSGIYLFFCSERIMRIILDTRQNNERNKRANRSTTTAAGEPLDSAMVAQVAPPYDNKPKNVVFASETASSNNRSVEKNSGSQRKSMQRRRRLYPFDGEFASFEQCQSPRHSFHKYKLVPRTNVRFANYKRKKCLTRRRETELDENNLSHPGNPTNKLETFLDFPHSSQSSFHCESSFFSSSSDSKPPQFGGGCSEDSNSAQDRHGSLSSDSLPYIRKSNDDANDLYDRHDLDAWVEDDHQNFAREPYFWDGSGSDKRRIHYEIEPCRLKERGLTFDTVEKSVQRPKRDRLDSSDFGRCAQSQRPKQEISTVAWMIILGDGIHNFIDGISIGTAFSESILSGVSISVAVICEEFPHELGDFAVLVSSGMTVRQALGYNFLSACTCYFGMAVGIIIGDVTDGASYISALAAGVFLYIALVDMMGELSAALEASSRDSIARTLKLLLLQNVGIFIGISIIFVLSFIDF